jgi:hypothetical protein
MTTFLTIFSLIIILPIIIFTLVLIVEGFLAGWNYLWENDGIDSTNAWRDRK